MKILIIIIAATIAICLCQPAIRESLSGYIHAMWDITDSDLDDEDEL